MNIAALRDVLTAFSAAGLPSPEEMAAAVERDIGRLDGLHQRQPWTAFDEAGMNKQIIVIDPENKQKWTAPLTSLPVSLQEQLSSTNMQFQQHEDILYFIGGYGYSKTALNHITYNTIRNFTNFFFDLHYFTSIFFILSPKNF